MSATTPNQRRLDAGYKTGATKDSCAKCAMHSPSKLHFQRSRYDLHCAELDAPVKTHGSCSLYLPGPDADIPGMADELPDAA